MSGTRRAFTVAEANHLLPEMEAVLSKIREEMFHVQNRREKLQILDALWGDEVERPENPDHGEFMGHHRRVELATRRIRKLVEEDILGRGIRFPTGGLQHGLLDFPTTYRGRWVYLCWRSGEEAIRSWHEVDGGFAGRRPLTREQVRVMGREDDPDAVDGSVLDF